MGIAGDTPERLPAPPGDAAASQPSASAAGSRPRRRRAALAAVLARFIVALRDNDESQVEAAVLQLSRSRPWLTPLALATGAFAMLFDGVRLLFTNWRLTLIQVLPAMWIWAAMIDLKAHLLHGKSFDVLRGPALIPVVLAIVAITAVSFYLNAVFAFAIVQPGKPMIRPLFPRLERILASCWDREQSSASASA